MDLLTFCDLFLTFDPIHVINIFLVSSIHVRCIKPVQNRTLFKVFALLISMTTNDLYVTFGPYPWTSYMYQGSVIILFKCGGHGSLFEKQVAFLVVVVK